MPLIAIVEDEPIMRLELGQLLEFEGYEVVTAANGREAIELISQSTPDLILCDIGIPEIDGYGVLKWTRTDYERPTVPFIFLTAFRYEVNRNIAEKLGCTAYVTKPFDIDSLLSTIHTSLQPS